jgi:hypothetical protein
MAADGGQRRSARSEARRRPPRPRRTRSPSARSSSPVPRGHAPRPERVAALGGTNQVAERVRGPEVVDVVVVIEVPTCTGGDRKAAAHADGMARLHDGLPALALGLVRYPSWPARSHKTPHSARRLLDGGRPGLTTSCSATLEAGTPTQPVGLALSAASWARTASAESAQPFA